MQDEKRQTGLDRRDRGWKPLPEQRSCIFHPVFVLLVLLLAIGLTGCVSLQLQKVREGGELAPGDGLAVGRSSLQDVLSRCGAPDEVVDMDPEFALHYRRLLQRSLNVSVGIPLKQFWLPNPSLEGRGKLQRYDTAVLVFTSAGVLKDVRYEKATDRPLMSDFW